MRISFSKDTLFLFLSGWLLKQSLIWQSTFSTEASYRYDPVHARPRCMQIDCKWMMHYAVRDRRESCIGETLCCVFIGPSLGCFISPGVGLVCTMPTAAKQPRVRLSIPARLHSSPWCIREPGVVHMADTFQYRQSVLIITSGTLIPKCIDLSQFREDTGEPSVSVPEFNLIVCPLAWSSQKPLPDLDLNPGWRELSAHQPSRHCGLLTVV